MALHNGFLIVASLSPEYARTASFAAGSIKDYYPDAHITLFVSKEVEEYVDRSVFDLIISDGVPNHRRAKLHSLSRTPYSNLTVYVDADMECMHKDIQTIWDSVSPDADITLTEIRPYNGKIAVWDNGRLTHHCGFFVYKNEKRVLDFMDTWWEDYAKQISSPWPYTDHPKELAPWDQFTFWKLLNVDKMDINVQFFKDDARWNFVNGYKNTETNNPIIFYHHTVPSKQHQTYL